MSTDKANHPGLDPADWNAFRSEAHALLDACLDRMTDARNLPWQPIPDEVQAGYALPETPLSLGDLRAKLTAEIMPYATGNTHPRFFGWVHGTGLATGLLSEMVAATMNSNLGGRDHGLNYVEREVIDWARDVFGFPSSASGLLVAGTSQATVIALSAARLRALGADVRKSGTHSAPQLTLYSGAAAHNALRKAVELLGIGTDHLRLVPDGESGPDMAELERLILADKAAGHKPMALIATAGSVDLGRFDDLNAMADLAQKHGLWLHVDGAFGAWTRLADAPWRGLSDGMERADSLACDFHKWMYVPYDCGLILIRDETEHRAAFAARPSYLAAQDQGLGGGEPWFCDYGIDLSRGNRALKVWTALAHYGPARLGAAITANCAQAALMGELVSATDAMALAAPVVSNLCTFSADTRLSVPEQSALNTRIAMALQLSGEVVFSTTLVNGVTVLRAAITNHRTTADDIHLAIRAVERLRNEKRTA